MKKLIVCSLVLLLTPFIAAAAGSAGGDDRPSFSAPVDSSVADLVVPALTLTGTTAASCGHVVLDWCHDPRFPSQVTASCHPAQHCSCASLFATCQSLVHQFCGTNVQQIVVTNCS
jgi:hypothetical protein